MTKHSHGYVICAIALEWFFTIITLKIDKGLETRGPRVGPIFRQHRRRTTGDRKSLHKPSAQVSSNRS